MFTLRGTTTLCRCCSCWYIFCAARLLVGLVNQSLDRPVLCSRSAAVTRSSTPRTAAIAPVAEEGGGWGCGGEE